MPPWRFWRIRVASLFTPLRLSPWRNHVLVAAATTTGTGFVFPCNGATPVCLVGPVATVILMAVPVADRRPQAGPPARRICAGGMVNSLWLLVFVLIARTLLKVPALNAPAPTGTQPAFAVTPLAVPAVIVVIGLKAMPVPVPTSAAPRGPETAVQRF